MSLVCTPWNLIRLKNITSLKKQTNKPKNKIWEILKLCFSQQYPPFPCEVFYKPNLAAVYAAKDVYSLLYSGSLSNYWSSSLKLSGDWLKLKYRSSLSACSFVTHSSFWADLSWQTSVWNSRQWETSHSEMLTSGLAQLGEFSALSYVPGFIL